MFSKWGAYLTEVSDKPTIEVGKPQKSLKLFAGGKYKPVGDHPYPFRDSLHLPTLEDIAKKRDGRNVELTYSQFSSSL